MVSVTDEYMCIRVCVCRRVSNKKEKDEVQQREEQEKKRLIKKGEGREGSWKRG